MQLFRRCFGYNMLAVQKAGDCKHKEYATTCFIPLFARKDYTIICCLMINLNWWHLLFVCGTDRRFNTNVNRGFYIRRMISLRLGITRSV